MIPPTTLGQVKATRLRKLGYMQRPGVACSEPSEPEQLLEPEPEPEPQHGPAEDYRPGSLALRHLRLVSRVRSTNRALPGPPRPGAPRF